MAAEVRLKKLEELVLDRNVVGLETLVDLLFCVHHELSTSPLAQEKYIMEFLQWGESCWQLLWGAGENLMVDVLPQRGQ